MVNNKFLLFLLFIFILSVSAVSADENITHDVNAHDGYAVQESQDIGNFTTLNDEISNLAAGDYYKLKKDYTYNPDDSDFINGVKITEDNVVIDGDGHTIDGAGMARIFDIVSNNVTLKNINFVNGHSSENGGAIYAKSSFNILNSTFTNNTAVSSGGAVFVESAFLDSKIDSTFINNSANSGGAIYFKGTTVNLTVNGYFENNLAQKSGGAIYVYGASTNATFASEFYNNSANRTSGGAIFFRSSVENSLFDSIFKYNRAGYGAGIFFYKSSNINRFSSDFRYNVALSCGGAMFFHNTTNNNNFTGYFINNSALGKLDEVNGNGGAITFKDTSSNCRFECDFINNTAAKTGGGVNYRHTPFNITFNSSFINNQALVGGGVNFFESFENVVFNGKFTRNFAVYGGAIALKNGVIENIIFEDNSAETGGAIYFDEDGAVSNCVFNRNFISDEYGDGGAIYFNNAGVVSNSNFTGNRAVYYGGAVYFKANGTVIDSNFNNNDAQNGGSVYIYGAGEVNNCNFTNNSARTGGAIEFWKNATVTNAMFNDNYARYGGGAIYSSGALNITESVFNRNSAAENTGGAVYVYSEAEILYCNFTNNTSREKGGSAYFNSDAIVKNVLVSNSKTKEGAIYFRKNGTVEQSNFTNNNANDGGAIVAYGNLSISNSNFENNSASYGTNHVSLKGNATITLINVDPSSIEPFYIGYLTVINATNVTYGKIVIITVNVTDKNSNPFKNGTVSCVIAGKTYSVGVENGTASLVIDNLNARNYNVNVTYDGGEYVAISQAKFTVFKKNAVITAVSKAYIINYGGKYFIRLKDSSGNLLKGKTVEFILNGKKLKSGVTGANGIATLVLAPNILKAAKAGTKNLVIRFSDSNYNTVSKTVKIKILKEKTKIFGVNKNFIKSKKIKVYVAYLKDIKGKAVKKALVTLKVNGKIYKVKTNLKGQAIFKITKLTKKGKFKAAIKFAGNGYYQLSFRTVLFNVR